MPKLSFAAPVVIVSGEWKTMARFPDIVSGFWSLLLLPEFMGPPPAVVVVYSLHSKIVPKP